MTFEVQTAREATGLGCGDLIASGAHAGEPRPCWLVIVPRGEKDVDGRSYDQLQSGFTRPGVLQSSPLSKTNFDHKIAFRLDFQPLNGACSIGAHQVPMLGSEAIAGAIGSWQPALCKSSGNVYGYVKAPDSYVERRLTGAATGNDAALGFVTAPLAPASIPAL